MRISHPFLALTGIVTTAALPLAAQTLPTATKPARANGAAPLSQVKSTLDTLVFGAAASEQAHGFKAPLSEAFSGALSQRARRLLPKAQPDIYGGELLFSMKVDPARRNYFSLKMWGEDSAVAGALLLYVPGKGADYQVGYRAGGDYLPLSAGSGRAELPGRFHYVTTLLPLEMTLGKTQITLKIVSTGRINAGGTGSETAGGNYQLKMSAKSRGIYRAYTHLEAMLNPTGEVQGAAPSVRPDTAPAFPAIATAFTTGINNRIKTLLDTEANDKTIAPADVLYLARSYSVAGSSGYQNPAVVAKVGAFLDAFAAENAANAEAASLGGRQSWGGRFGALGRAIELLKTPLQPLLSRPTAGSSSPTRRAAWGNLLFASREYGRFNRRGNSAETMLGDASLYSANQGLLALGDARAFPEATAQRYLHEAVGISPWLGNDLPGGGHETPFGANFFMVTAKGLPREWDLALPDRGVTAAQAVSSAVAMWELSGNPEFRAQAIKMLGARGLFQRSAVAKVGANLVATVEPINTLAASGGQSASTSASTSQDSDFALAALRVAATSRDATAVGYARQMLAQTPFLSALAADKAVFNSLGALDVPGDLQKLAGATGDARLPMTQNRPVAWSDEENGVVVLQRGTDRLWMAPFWGAGIGTGIGGVGRFHFSTPRYDQIGICEVVPQFRAQGVFIRPASFIDRPETAGFAPPKAPLQAYGGQRLPIGVAPADARYDAPFRGHVDFYAWRFGPYLFGLNRTQNRTFSLKTPTGFTSAPDLFSGAPKSGAVQVAPRSTVALFLGQSSDAAPIPIAPLAVTVASGAGGASLEWNAASGAATYTIKRAPSEEGPYQTLKSGLLATRFSDSQAPNGDTYFYSVIAVNKNGESYESMKVASFASFVIERTVAPSGGIRGVGVLGGPRPPSGGAAPNEGAPNPGAPLGGDAPIPAEPFVLEGNTEDGAPPPPRPTGPSGPPRPTAPA